jgi:capsular polysaccharide export protein
MNEKPNVLLYVEAHPIRNSFSEHFHIAKILGPVLGRFAARGKIDLRVFANQHVCAQIKDEMPGVSRHLVEPTEQEAAFIETQFGRWNRERINRWLELVKGEGDVTDAYVGMLERRHAERPIDIVLLWSENGAVRRFCEMNGIPVLHGELGPTRPPFVETMYFDIGGTNGNATARYKTYARLSNGGQSEGELPSARTWLLTSERGLTTAETRPSLLDLPITFQPDFHCQLPEKPYVFVAMQLADDLNTLIHSPYKTPQAFLEAAMRDITDKGYHAVIKGHPGAAARPFNLRKEVEALRYVEENFDNVVILPRTANTSLSLYALANARYSMSINSSVSFESMLLGVPSVVKGSAAFDAAGLLQERIQLRPVEKAADYRDDLNALTSTYLMRHLVPKSIVLNSDYLYQRICKLLKLDIQTEVPSWDFAAWHILGAEHLPSSDVQRAGSEAITTRVGDSLFENTIMLLEDEGKMVLSDAVTTLELSGPKGLILGTIDEVVRRNGNICVSGWCLEQEDMARPVAILGLRDGIVSSARSEVVERYDVHGVFPDAEEEALLSGFNIEFPDPTENEGEFSGLLIITKDLGYHLVTQLDAGQPIVQTDGLEAPRSVQQVLRRLFGAR